MTKGRSRALGEASKLARGQRTSQRATERHLPLEGAFQKSPVAFVLLDRNERCGAACESEDGGIDVRCGSERASRKPRHDRHLEPRSPVRASQSRGPDRRVLLRELPLHDDIGPTEARLGLPQEAEQDLSRTGEREVGDDREPLVRPAPAAGVDFEDGDRRPCEASAQVCCECRVELERGHLRSGLEQGATTPGSLTLTVNGQPLVIPLPAATSLPPTLVVSSTITLTIRFRAEGPVGTNPLDDDTDDTDDDTEDTDDTDDTDD